MGNYSALVLTIFIVLLTGIIHHQPSVATRSNFSRRTVISAWIPRAPYVIPPDNESVDNDVQGMIRDALLRYIMVECGQLLWPEPKEYLIVTKNAGSEIKMLELLRQNKVHIAMPISEHPINRRYKEFPFFKVDDYPGTEYITTDEDYKPLAVVLKAVLKSWPLFAVTLVLTAIAGIILWALVGIFLCNIVFY